MEWYSFFENISVRALPHPSAKPILRAHSNLALYKINKSGLKLKGFIMFYYVISLQKKMLADIWTDAVHENFEFQVLTLSVGLNLVMIYWTCPG